MARFKYVGEGPKGEAQERAFDGGFGRCAVTVSTGDVLDYAGPVGVQHVTPDLEPYDADTRRQWDLVAEQLRIAAAREFGPGTPPSGGV
jgi:hypothetical protein